MKLLVIGDSPTENTGFACVVRNSLRHWGERFERIDIWGINYNGWPHDYPYRIYPAGKVWHAMENLAKLINFIRARDYTHIWILQDTFLLSANGFPGCLKLVCREKKIRIVTYYPVDAPLEPEWLDIVRVSDAAATFTEYGQAETARAAGETIHVNVIPHGVDTDVFRPLDAAVRAELRREIFPPAWQEAFILINVNRNERRKGLTQSLQVLKELNRIPGEAFKLYLHCPAENTMERTDLKQIGSALGLEYGRDWMAANEEDFARGVGRLHLEEVNDLYNASDLCITTTLGEGWGLSLTEAAAAGLRVIGPDHTSLPEIAMIVGDRMQLVPRTSVAITNMLDNSRVRYPVNVPAMVSQVVYQKDNPDARAPLSEQAKETLSWDRISRRWLDFF